MKQRDRIHINIGDYYASRRPVTLHTTLGSCVAVCLYDKEKRIGGMNHILLPGSADLRSFNESARYGINSMELLINKMISQGAEKRKLVAKVFGGAHIMPEFQMDDSIGRKNIEFVKQFLEVERIRILAQHTGGIFTRTIYYHTDTAEVFMKKLKSSFYKTAAEEKAYMDQFRTEIIKPDITFF
ncbi:MAG: chemotaxis protein CheD [Syntrophothermus sp.]